MTKKIKPKYHLTAKQMDELVENEIVKVKNLKEDKIVKIKDTKTNYLGALKGIGKFTREDRMKGQLE